uniref:AAA family ATPase n=1 Tax=Alloprevotella tannerae TaxID=76122 RepID=A0A929RX76_9BACT|nr:AAA family ATPase [Alloprevotella tannerae]
MMMHRKTTLSDLFKYDLTDEDEFVKHSHLIFQIAQDLMLREFRMFDVDDHNKNVLRFLTYYFNGCLEAEKVFPNENYKIHKNLLLIGEPGTGKTMLMQIFSDYLRLTENVNQFKNISSTQLMNYYKIHNHIDKFTFNELAHPNDFGGDPFNVCLNDLGLQTEKQKSYGTMLTQITDEFLFARYEIYQQTGKRYHITSNLTVEELKDRFEDRLIDRFKSFNVIELRGRSRRK